MLTLQELVDRIIDRVDPEELVDRLNLSTNDILERFLDVLQERRYRFEDIEEEELGEEEYDENEY